MHVRDGAAAGARHPRERALRCNARGRTLTRGNRTTTDERHHITRVSAAGGTRHPRRNGTVVSASCHALPSGPRSQIVSGASSGDHHLPRRSPPRARAERPTVLPGRSVEPSVEPRTDRWRRKGRGRMGTHRRTPRRTLPGPSGTGCRARGAASEHLRSRSLWPCVVGTCKKLRESTWCDCIRIREVKRNPKGEPAFLPEKGCIDYIV